MNTFQLRYGPKGFLALLKSPTTVGLRPKTGEAESVLSGIAPWISEANSRGRNMGGFRVLEISGSGQPLEEILDVLRRSEHVAVGTHVYYTSADAVPFVPTGKLFIRFVPGTDHVTRQSLLDAASLQVLEVRDEQELIAQVTKASVNPVKTALLLQQSADVAIAEPCLATPVRQLGSLIPSAAEMANQWHLHNPGGKDGLKEFEDARVVEAWKRLGSLGSPDVVVAIIDGGCEVGHSEWDRKVVHAINFANRSTTLDSDGHGTACAGLAIANANGRDVVGVAPGSRFMPIQFNADFCDCDLEEWFDYVRDRGAAVLNCSWKALADVYKLSTMAHEAIARCAKASRGGLGCVISFGAGNDGKNIDDPNGATLNGFAIHPDVLAVSVMTSMGARSPASSFGERIAVCAPSGGDGGLDLVTTDLMGAAGRNPNGNVRDDFGQTSGAAAIVSGVCALVVAACPSLKAKEVRDIIKSTARPVADLLRQPKGSHSPFMGFGCVNALAAVDVALEVCRSRDTLQA